MGGPQPIRGRPTRNKRPTSWARGNSPVDCFQACVPTSALPGSTAECLWTQTPTFSESAAYQPPHQILDLPPDFHNHGNQFFKTNFIFYVFTSYWSDISGNPNRFNYTNNPSCLLRVPTTLISTYHILTLVQRGGAQALRVTPPRFKVICFLPIVCTGASYLNSVSQVPICKMRIRTVPGIQGCFED